MKKKLIMGLSILGIVSSLIGCSALNKNADPLTKLSKKELIAQCNAQNEKLNQANVELEDLKVKLKGIQQDNKPSASIIEVQDGTGRLTFKSTEEHAISFPEPFEYPGSTQAPNTSSVNIAEHISIVPTINWTMQLNGTTLELQHNSGITGTIKAGSIDKTIKRTELEKEMSKFFNNLPPEKIDYHKLFLGDNCWGIEGKAPTTIDSKPAQIRCGFLGLGDVSFSYVFVYKGELDNTKDETILNLLRSMKVLSQELRIE